jgi:hypothetical protein
MPHDPFSADQRTGPAAGPPGPRDEWAALAAQWTRLASELDGRAAGWTGAVATWTGDDVRARAAADRVAWAVQRTREVTAWQRQAAKDLLDLT